MLYSVALLPPPNIVNEVRKMKLQLKERIGWYGSSNSQAHITVCEFEDEGLYLKAWQEQLEKFAATMSSFEVHFDQLAMFSGGGMFLKPEFNSAVSMNSLMKKLYKRTAALPSWKTGWPHMTIARTLNPFQVAQAAKVFKSMKMDIGFECAQLCLRRHNPERGQFDIMQIYRLTGQQLPCNLVGQLALF